MTDARSALRRVLVSTVVAAVAASLWTAGAAAPSAARAATGGDGEVSVEAAAALDGEDVVVRYRVQNDGTETVEAAEATVTLGRSPITDSDELEAWLAGEGTGPSGVSEAVEVASVGSNSAGEGSVRFPADEVPSVASGVYPVEVEIDRGGSIVEARTVLHRVGTAASGLGVILPVVLPVGSSPLPGADALAAAVAPDGPLGQVLAIARAQPVVLAVDPRVPAAIRALGDAAPAAAVTWLAELTALERPSFALPFAAADPAAQVRLGLAEPLAPTSLAFATYGNTFSAPVPAGQATATPQPAPASAPSTEELLEWPASVSGVVWPASVGLDGTTLDALATQGTPILSSAVLDGEPDGQVATVNGHRALVSDAAIGAAIGKALAAEDDVAWASAATEAAALVGLAPEGAGAPLVAIDPGAIGGSDRLSQTVTALTAGRVALQAPALESEPAAEVALAETADDATEARLVRLQRAIDLAGQVDAYAGILDDPALLSGLQRARLLDLFSVALVSPEQSFPEAADRYDTVAAETLDAVRLADPATVLPFSYESLLPVQVMNDLPWPVTVTVSARPENNRLTLPAPQQTLTVEGASSGTAQVPIQARVGTGDVDVLVDLIGRNGAPIGGTVSIPVSVHADWELIGMVVLGALVALFLSFGVWRSIRNRRRRDAEATTTDG